MRPIHIRVTIEELDDDGEAEKTSTMLVRADGGFLDFLKAVGDAAVEEAAV